MLTPGHALAEVIAGRNLGAGDQEQHFFQGTGHPPGLAIIAELCKMPQQHRQSGRCKFRFRSLAHGFGSNESEPQGITHPSQLKILVNLTASPCVHARIRLRML